jgi:pimeloyl-ACP methyl ester carboxylesterase
MIAIRTVDVPESPLGRAARIAVHVAGKGPLAVLVHGFPLDHRMWLDVLHGPLARQRTLAAVDLRGHGASPSSGDPVHTMALFAHDVAAVIRSLGDEPADVAGLSMGGYVAFAVWADHRELVRSLVLANTRAVADSGEARAGRDAAVQTVVDKGRRALVAGMAEKMLAPRADALLRARLFTMAQSLPVESVVADLRGLKERPDREPLLARIDVPALVVTGAHDPIAPPAESKAFADRIRGARFVEIAGAAHLTPMEQPEAFTGAVRTFWAD